MMVISGKTDPKEAVGYKKVRLEATFALRATISVLEESPLKLIAIIEDEISHDLIHHTTTGDNAYVEAEQWIRDNFNAVKR